MKTKSPTRSITYYEQNVLLPILKRGLEMKKGKINAVTNNQIVYGLKKQGLKVNSRSVKKVINYIRMNDLIVGLMGCKSGYYIISSEQEFIDYEDNLLSHEVALRKVRMCMQRQRRSLFTEDQKLAHIQTQLF